MLYVVGLGLSDVKDITVKGLEVVRRADRVYLEAYTSILCDGKEALEQFYGRDLIIADRDLVEQRSSEILEAADVKDVAFLVVGDPFGATTHTDLVLRAKEAGVECKVIHNASILSAIGCCGLQLYSFGETVSIPFWTDSWKPDSFYNKIVENKCRGLHTLCLLAGALKADSLCVGVARVGSDSQKMVVCSIEQMTAVDLGPPLHSLIICSDQLHPLEAEYLEKLVPTVKPVT
ncbi:diphthine methyl ester synthase isoform X3 [Schistocerca americana]|uniref:diphthine methyl ester synthase isoform X3 n=1 Tax=Schistocerca americana TaxID=7009 RepID=UPI001F4F6090|nr:diphthine methyl ester synthase isoform X3 [Schistocerca americana]XP_049814452.1 diphthine methyl ester synthase isoform X4 [Schistocerca nitens]